MSETHGKAPHGRYAEEVVKLAQVVDPPLQGQGSGQVAEDMMLSYYNGGFVQPQGEDMFNKGINVPDQPEKNRNFQVLPCLAAVNRIFIEYVNEPQQGYEEEDMAHEVDDDPLRRAVDLNSQGSIRKEKQKQES